MKIIIFLSVLFFSYLSSALCIQNFNAYGPVYAPDIEGRSARLLTSLKQDRCDVIQLQEVWDTNHAYFFINGLNGEYQITSPNLENRIGVMSFFKGTILSTQTIKYGTNSDGGFLDGVRGLLGVEKAFHVSQVNMNELGENVFFINTHLHPSSSAVRVAQILDLYRWRVKNQNLKLILSGDFNAGIPSFERKLLMLLLGAHDTMEETFSRYSPSPNYCTYCGNNPLGWLSGENHVFDYIFVSNISQFPSSLVATSGQVNLKGDSINGPLSDHYGIRVDIKKIYQVILLSNAQKEERKERLLGILLNVRSLIYTLDSNVEEYNQLILDIFNSIHSRQGIHWDYFFKYY